MVVVVPGQGVFDGFNQAVCQAHREDTDNIPHGSEKYIMPRVPNPLKYKWKHHPSPFGIYPRAYPGMDIVFKLIINRFSPLVSDQSTGFNSCSWGNTGKYRNDRDTIMIPPAKGRMVVATSCQDGK